MTAHSHHPSESPAITTQPVGIRFVADACYPLRHRGHGCESCVTTCPVGAISFGPTGFVVAAACTGCGRCTVVCPMGALTVGSIAAPVSPGMGAIECARVPEGCATSGAARVPCAGACDVAYIVEAHLAHGHGPAVMDRGLCGDCPSGGRETFVAQAAVGAARDLLESMGVAISALPKVVSMPVDVVSAGTTCAPDTPASPARRGFLSALGRGAGRGLLDQMAPSESTVAASATARLARPARPSTARLSLLAAVTRLARARGLPVPHTLFRSAWLDESCCDRGLCVATCPTAALERVETSHPDGGDSVELRFSAMRCIDCGACVQACPERALHLDPCCDDSWRTPQTLRSFGRQTCASCGEHFVALHGESDCEPCAKSRALIKDAYQLFGNRPDPIQTSTFGEDMAGR